MAGFSVVTLTLASHLSRALRTTSWWCTAEAGPIQTLGFGTVPDQGAYRSARAARYTASGTRNGTGKELRIDG